MKLDTKAIEKIVLDRATDLPAQLTTSPSALLEWAVTTTLQQVSFALEKDALDAPPPIPKWYNLKELTDLILEALGEMTPAQYIAFQATSKLAPLQPQVKADEQVWPVIDVNQHMYALKQYKLQNNIK